MSGIKGRLLSEVKRRAAQGWMRITMRPLMIEGLLTSDVTNEFTLLTSFGDFFHDPHTGFCPGPHLGQGIR